MTTTVHSPLTAARLQQLASPQAPPLTDGQRTAIWEDQFRHSPSLRAEFRTLSTYVAFMRARHRGQVGPRTAPR